MPFGHGYLVNINDINNVIDVGKSNHAYIILRNPEYFDLSEQELRYIKQNDDDENNLLFDKIFDKGWIRIRIFQHSVSFQYNNISDDLMSRLILSLDLNKNYSLILEDDKGFVDIPSYSYFLQNNANIEACRQRLKNKSLLSQFREQYASIINKLIKLCSRKHDYSCILYRFDKEIKKQVQDMIKEIVNDDIIYKKGDYGIEKDTHVTIKWGITTNEVDEFKDFLKQKKSFEIELGNLSLFDNSKHNDISYDVLKIEVKSTQIHNLHKSISNNFETEETHKDFKPHITLCYLKKGKCPQEILGKNRLTGTKIKIDNLLFIDKNSKETKISLLGH